MFLSRWKVCSLYLSVCSAVSAFLQAICFFPVFCVPDLLLKNSVGFCNVHCSDDRMRSAPQEPVPDPHTAVSEVHSAAVLLWVCPVSDSVLPVLFPVGHIPVWFFHRPSELRLILFVPDPALLPVLWEVLLSADVPEETDLHPVLWVLLFWINKYGQFQTVSPVVPAVWSAH